DDRAEDLAGHCVLLCCVRQCGLGDVEPVELCRRPHCPLPRLRGRDREGARNMIEHFNSPPPHPSPAGGGGSGASLSLAVTPFLRNPLLFPRIPAALVGVPPSLRSASPD